MERGQPDRLRRQGQARPQGVRARLLKLTQRIIVDVDPRAQIILAGMPEITGRGFYVHKYLRLYRVRGIERKFDAVGLHPYARNWRGSRAP